MSAINPLMTVTKINGFEPLEHLSPTQAEKDKGREKERELQ